MVYTSRTIPKSTSTIAARHADVWSFAGSIVLSAQVRIDLADPDPDPGRRVAPASMKAGATHLILIVHRPFRPGMATQLAEEVVARVR